MTRFRLDPTSPNGFSAAPEPASTPVMRTVPRLQRLNDLEDVAVGTPQDKQALAYDAASNKFIPQTLATGSTNPDGTNQTNLSASTTATTVIVASDTGADATLASASSTQAGILTASDKTKLDGIATGATANSTDAFLLDRTNHTGTQPATTITGLATVATTGSYNDLTNKPTIPTVSGTNSGDQTLSIAGSTLTISGANGNSVTLPTSGGTTVSDASTTAKGIVKLAGDLAGTADLPTVPGLASKANSADLATVATSGSYTDLSNKPTIPAQFNPIAGTNVTLSGTYPNITFSAAGGAGAPADATTTSKGVVQLAGDLAGTAAAPTVPGLANKVSTSTTVNGKALSSNITLSASDVSAVPTTRTVNGKALSADISLTASEVGALDQAALDARTNIYGSNYMKTLRAGLANVSLAPIDMVFIGDSKTEGTGSSGPGYRWLDRFRTSFRSLYNPAGVTGGYGYIPGAYASPNMGNPWTLSGSATQTVSATGATYGLGKRNITMNTAAGTASIKVGPSTPWGAVTDVDIVYSQGSSQGSFTVAVDGGAATTVNANNATRQLGQRYSITGLSTSSDHTILITWVSSIVTIEGIMCYNGDKNQGIRIWDSAHHGVKAADYQTTDLWWEALSVIQPAVVYYNLGRNDFSNGASASTIVSTIQGHIAKIRSLITIDPTIIIGMDWQDSPTAPTDTYANWRTAIYNMVASDGNLALIDLYKYFGTINTSGTNAQGLSAGDLVHPSDKGNAAISAAFHSFLTSLATPQVAVSGGAGSTSVYGENVLSATFSITAANGTFQDTGLSLTLPSAGTYLLSFDCRIDLNASAGVPGWGNAKLFDATAGADVPSTARMCSITQVNAMIGTGTGSCSGKSYTVSGPATIKLYVARNNATTWTTSNVISNTAGYTMMSYQKIA